jgi:hypothetical protein
MSNARLPEVLTVLRIIKKSHPIAGTLTVNFPTGMLFNKVPTGIYLCSKVGDLQQI